MKRDVNAAILACLFASLCTSCGSKEVEPEERNPAGTTQWIDPSTIRPGPIRHESLPDELVGRIRAVQAVFAEVDPAPAEKWIEDFKRDMNPGREIVVWEAMARAYTSYTARQNLTLDERKELFGILLVGSGAPIDDALDHLTLKLLSEAEAREALETLAQSWEKK
jgi:hypothetical protein